MAYEYKVTRRVEFSETDAAGIMHFSNYFRFMEIAEQAFSRTVGFSVHDPRAARPLGWPRVHAECDYKKPLYFEDEVEIHLLVREKKEKSVTYVFLLRRRGAEVARGMVTVVCVEPTAEGGMKAVPIPREIAERIETAPKDLWA